MASKIRLAAQERFERQVVERAESKQLVDKWAHILNADEAPAVENAYDRYVLAMMLESQKQVLSRSQEALQTTTVFGSNYVDVMLGMTRQIFPRMFGTRLVSVQPLDRPTGQIFHLALTRDDGSSLGVRPQDTVGWNSTNYGVSKTYANHTNGEGGAIQKGMALNITSSNVEITKVKKLLVGASWELMTDLAAYHNLNAMDLLQGAAIDEIAQEKDAEIVAAVRTAAIANGTVTFGPAPSGWPVEKWASRVQRAILNVDKHIFARSLRHPNVMVCGMDALVELMDLASFKMSANVDWESNNYGIVPVGNLNTQYEVFLSRAIPDNEILLGRRGAGFLDAGVVYSPYVDLFVTDRQFDVTTQKTQQSFASRYEIFTISSTLYGRIVLDPEATAGISDVA